LFGFALAFGARGEGVSAARSDFWSFQPLRETVPPRSADNSWARNEIDLFVSAKHAELGLVPSGDADRRTLIRRATFDLTGLPPTPEEVEQFLDAPEPDAFARVVDRLLASRAYGERWGRHWLDCIRYADTAGCNSDFPVPSAYKFRNWVIDALNADMPYDEFIRRQIAGDLLPARGEDDGFDAGIATGYLAISRRFGSRLDDMHLTIEDTIDNLGKTFLGLSLNCARCHDHKYDPITVDDYYALYGIFQSTRYPFPGVEIYPSPRDFAFRAPPDEVARIRSREREMFDLDQRIEDLGNERRRLEREARKARDEARAVVNKPVRTVAQVRAEWEAAKARRDELRNTKVPFERAYAVRDGDRTGNARIHLKGDPKSPGAEVPRRFPAVLGGQAIAAESSGSGRLDLAAWLASPDNPLTARVMVNRVWHHHFGRGIVGSVNDFGARGEAPSHPELLDWLARRFIESEWSLKRLHRLILLSRTWQLSAVGRPRASDADSANRFLWRFEHRRLSAEEVRDSMLAISGRLDRSMGGEHPFPPENTWKFTQHKPFVDDYPTNRRAIYMMQQRIRKQPFLAVFDGADTNAATGDRALSTTPLQALFMMNDPFVHEQARGFAARIIAEAVETPARVTLASRLAFGIDPAPDEIALAATHLDSARRAAARGGAKPEDIEKLAWESYCRVVLGSNQFIYVD
jgi:hypothetical protein